MQKWVAETVRFLAQIGCGEKKMAAMQMHVQKQCRKGDRNCTNIVQN
jgi:hypothetical protein